MEQKFCQSCGMPMGDDLYGTKQNGEKSKDYCVYCYSKGEFVAPDLTIDQMKDICLPHMVQSGMDENEAKNLLNNFLPQLKRWRKTEMPTRAVQKTEIKVIGIEVRTTNKDGKCMEDIQNLWKRFLGENLQSRINNKAKPNEILAVYTNYDSNEFGMYSFVIGCEIKEADTIPDGMISLTIPCANYNVITAKGKIPEKLGEAWSYIWNADIKRAYIADFEVYDDRYNHTENSEVDIYISIK